MPYLLAFEKDVLRMHPMANIRRMAMEDNVLPLAKPIIGVSEKVYDELPVPAGTLTNISLRGYNMNEAIWGPDAYEFRPERWPEVKEKREFPFGVYGNLCVVCFDICCPYQVKMGYGASFSGSPSSCIGWRFRVIELHTFSVLLIQQFDFSPPDNGQDVRTVQTGLLTPIVAGKEHKGPQLPVKVTALRDE